MTQEDIKKRVLGELEVLVDSMGDYEWDSSIDDEAYVERINRKALRHFISQALDTAFKEWKKGVKFNKTWIKNHHYCIYNDGEQDCECYFEAVDELNKKLQELGE